MDELRYFSPMKILICGVDGAGKTTLAKALAPLLGAIHYDGDEVRAMTGNASFDLAGRIAQATTMRVLCDKVKAAGGIAIASFICPTNEIRAIFDADYTIWVANATRSQFKDTRDMFEDFIPDMLVNDWASAETANDIAQRLELIWNTEKPTAVVIGRFQPFHRGHKALVLAALKRARQVLIMVRSMPIGPDNPFTFLEVSSRIKATLAEFGERVQIMSAPNVSHVIYGREVGYKVEQVGFDEATEAIHARDLRDEGEED